MRPRIAIARLQISDVVVQRGDQLVQLGGIEFEFQDHKISHSIYFYDPDRHELEITTYEL